MYNELCFYYFQFNLEVLLHLIMGNGRLNFNLEVMSRRAADIFQLIAFLVRQLYYHCEKY